MLSDDHYDLGMDVHDDFGQDFHRDSNHSINHNNNRPYNYRKRTNNNCFRTNYDGVWPYYNCSFHGNILQHSYTDCYHARYGDCHKRYNSDSKRPDCNGN
jgi:hypothetical protein